MSKVPAKRSASTSAAQKRAAKQALERANAQRLAQIVNLHIAGMSLEQIGTQIGATAEEVDRLLSQDAQRYVRSQPALRQFVRNYVSGKYTKLLDAVWDDAVAPTSSANITANGFDRKLASQDRAIKILERMARLHGAEAPTQHEVQMDAAPEAVERLVSALSAGQGLAYDDSIFDVVDAEVVHEAADAEFPETDMTGGEQEL